jgi:hypothetical protein
MVLISSVQPSRRRHTFFFTAVLVGLAQLQLCFSQSHDQHQRNTLVEESKYKLTSLPPFHIKLEIDLSKVITGGNTQKNLRKLSGNSGEGWMTNVVDTTNNKNNDQSATSKPSKNNDGGGWFSNTDNSDPNQYQPPQNYESVGTYQSTSNNGNNQGSSGSWYADEISSSSSSSSSKPEQVAVDPLSSLTTVKDALQQTNTNGDKNLSGYIRNLLVEYTTDFVTFFSYEALQSSDRAKKGWDVVHAIDLRGSLLDVTFYHEETHFIEDSDNNNQEETFASLTFGFSGTAAILKGTGVDDVVKGDTGFQNSPIIGSNELRLMLRAAFAPPDGPYKYLTYVLDEANSDRKDFILNKMTYEDSLEHDATILLGGSREVTVRTDLDYPDGRAPLQASTLTFVGVGSEKAERRESIAVFFEGLFLVVFLGGFYMYASYKFRRNHLKQELMKYGEGAILVRSGEKTLFSPESKSKARYQFMTKWLKYNHGRKTSFPASMETLEEDGYFGSESFDSDDYIDRDLEIGLKESYDESNRDKDGLDMGPIDANSYGDYSFSRSGGVNTMKAIDDDMKENMQPSSTVGGLRENMLENVLQNGVVPIPAKDDENAAYLMSKRGKSRRTKLSPNGAGSVIVQRRYVQPAAPLEVLYGAAFLHGEAERVEAQRQLRKKKKIRASPSGRNRVKKKKKSTASLVAQAMSGQRSKHAVNPMMTITESIDEFAEEDYDSDEDEEELFAPAAYSPSNFMRNLSEWALGGKIGAEEEEEEEVVEGKSQSSPNAEVAESRGVNDEKKEDEDVLINKSSSPSSENDGEKDTEDVLIQET